MRRPGWRLQVRADGAFLVAPDCDDVTLEVDEENHLWLNFEVVSFAEAPAMASEEAAPGLLARTARILTSGAPIRLGGARTPVHWPSRLAQLAELDTTTGDGLLEPPAMGARPQPKEPAD